METEGPTSKKPAFVLGEIVCASLKPAIKLSIRRFVDRIYYCRDLSGSVATDLVYFERELQRSQANTLF